jgi:hypothetical protein
MTINYWQQPGIQEQQFALGVLASIVAGVAAAASEAQQVPAPGQHSGVPVCVNTANAVAAKAATNRLDNRIFFIIIINLFPV